MADSPASPPIPPTPPFNPEMLDRSVIALPLLSKMADAERDQRWLQELRNAIDNPDPAASAVDERVLEAIIAWLQQYEEDDLWRRLAASAESTDPAIADQLRARRRSFVQALWEKLPPQDRSAWLNWLRQLRDTSLGEWGEPEFAVIIDLNLQHHGGRAGARNSILDMLNKLASGLGDRLGANPKNEFVRQYLFGRLTASQIRGLVDYDTREATEQRAACEAERQQEQAVNPTAPPPKPCPDERAIYRIWPDFPINPLVNKSIATVKADAAQISYAATGEGMVWAVLDTGINEHAHFTKHGNLQVQAPLAHKNFTGKAEGALVDGFGHGTHVAGIIAGEQQAEAGQSLQAFSRERNGEGDVSYPPVNLPRISGIAPKCKLVSYKVMDEKGQGEASSLIAAIADIQELNGHGRNLLIHGVNMSVGYAFEPEWFACGQSPLCVEVNRLVRSGVVVVVAAGNTGYGRMSSQFNGPVSAGMSLTINDPGNADLAITVGATHRDMPHVYGVSYFSSKGPTGDGRLKPDLVAPGEKILSCAAGTKQAEMQSKTGPCDYLEQSGTSMAAPHVSGAVAAFLSVRREFIGSPEKVKDLFMASATDLKRERYFQGAGLVDLMRAIQSV